ncbi:transcription factor IIIB 60 kDa subunit-like isoform X2 [Actinidia eriantha]|uniref:transcription factor IIIB 60 kDa subunit-like isoform X2 n=1 Tax=Actinidia eriantha TaxID=165200 RepID=UPI00258EE45E|nr:transcription factor IIIB 60 kDa subunit-like isoform X2 [Actinidia eriantha]
MVWCPRCDRDRPQMLDFYGNVKLLCQDVLTEEPTSVKGSRRELKRYLNTKEECYYKKIIWEKMNKEYLQELAAKEADVAITGVAVAKSRKERRQKQALEGKNANCNQTASEETRQMLTKKRLSSKINYDALDKLFNEEPAPDSKRARFESQHASSNVDGKQFDNEGNEAYAGNNSNEQEQENGDMEELVGKEAYVDEWYSRNEEEEFDYGYYDNDGDDEY